MSLQSTDVYAHHEEELKPLEINGQIQNPLQGITFHPVRTVPESMELCNRKAPSIIISAAGMLTGGRILHHLKARLPKEENAVLFCGYQAAETKGRLLQEGIQKIRIHHEEIPVNAEIISINSLSAHADQKELTQFVSDTKNLKSIFINHGEPQQSQALKKQLEQISPAKIFIPSTNESFNLWDL